MLTSNCAEVFGDIYARKLWGDGSGGGSAPGVAVPFAALVSRIALEMKPRTILDIGCGDGWCAAIYDLGDAQYIGVDVVPAMVEFCKEAHPTRGEFQCLDVLTDELPAAELVILKEVTQHLSDEQIAVLLDRLKGRTVIHASVSTGGSEDGGETGGCRPVFLADMVEGVTPLLAWSFGESTWHAELVRL